MKTSEDRDHDRGLANADRSREPVPGCLRLSRCLSGLHQLRPAANGRDCTACLGPVPTMCNRVLPPTLGTKNFPYQFTPLVAGWTDMFAGRMFLSADFVHCPTFCNWNALCSVDYI